MDAMRHAPSESEARMAHVSREELVERLGRVIVADGTVDPLPGLRLRRAAAPTELAPGVAYPSLLPRRTSVGISCPVGSRIGTSVEASAGVLVRPTPGVATFAAPGARPLAPRC